MQASGSFEKFQQTAGGSSSDPESLKRTVYDTVRRTFAAPHAMASRSRWGVSLMLWMSLMLVMTLSRMYRVRGHLNANLDPLGLQTQPVLAVRALLPDRVWIGARSGDLIGSFGGKRGVGWEWSRRIWSRPRTS